MTLTYVVNKQDNGKTVKEILLDKLNISKRLLLTLKTNNLIYLNNKSVPTWKTVTENDVILLDLSYSEDNSNIVAKEIPLDIIYEDEFLIIVNKPSGIPVHPSISHYEDSLSSGIKFYFDSIGLKKKIRPVNRIDKDTSGIVIFAKNEYIQEELVKQMKSDIFVKEYIAICSGYLGFKKSTINLPIARKENSIIERCVNSNGDKSITHYEVLKEKRNEEFKLDYSVVRCKLETGRTHQIRVHFSHIGFPLLGDDLYGGNTQLIKRQTLHSYKVSFIHPITRKNVTFEAPVPSDMLKLIEN